MDHRDGKLTLKTDFESLVESANVAHQETAYGGFPSSGTKRGVDPKLRMTHNRGGIYFNRWAKLHNAVFTLLSIDVVLEF